MANKYWYGGTGTWNNTANSHWESSPGAADNVAPPASGDTAVFSSTSGSGTVLKASTGTTIGGLDMTGSSVTIDWNSVTLAWDTGNVTLAAGKCTGSTGVWTFSGTADQTLTSAGYSIASITRGGPSGTTQKLILADDLTMTATFTLNRAGIDMNGFNFTVGTFTTGAGTTGRFLTMGSGTMTVNTGLTWGTTAGFTLNANTATLMMTNGTMNVGAGFTMPSMVHQTTAFAGSVTYNCASTLPSLQIRKLHNITCAALLAATLTISGLLETIFTDSSTQVGIKSDTGGTPRTLTVNGAAKLRNVVVTDITAAGTTPFVAEYGSTDGGGNTNVVIGGRQSPFIMGGVIT